MDIKKYIKTIESLQTHQRMAIKEEGLVFNVSVSKTQVRVFIAVGRKYLSRILYFGAPFAEATKLIGLVDDFLARNKPEMLSQIVVDEVLCDNKNCQKRVFCKRHRLYDELLVGKLSPSNEVYHFHKPKGADCKHFIPDKK